MSTTRKPRPIHKLTGENTTYDPDERTACGLRRKHRSCFVDWRVVTCPDCLGRKQ